MLPTRGFLADLALMSPSLRIREVSWRHGLAEGEQAFVWPIKGKPFQADPSTLPSRARLVVYEVNSLTGAEERIFDVVYPDGHPMPPDRRTLEGLALRMWWTTQNVAKLREETMERERKARVRNEVLALEREGSFPESMERLFREEHGITRHALGGPGAPASPRLGGGLSGVEYEATSKPPSQPRPPAENIRIAYE